MTKRVIIDTDAGVDDALALILALHSPELKVEAITAVSGNVPVNQVCKNIFRVFDLLRRDDVPPVARGADRFLRQAYTGAEEVHGRDGLGDLSEVIIMGGAATVAGNVTPYAEFNIWADPEAAQLVLQSGLPITLVGLDVTHRVILSKREVSERLTAEPNSLSRFIQDCTGKYMEFHKKVEGFEGCYTNRKSGREGQDYE